MSDLTPQEQQTREETLNHIKKVQEYIALFIDKLLLRAKEHDKTKLEEPESEYFLKYTPLLKDSVYGSEQYYEFLKQLKPALDHHYLSNPHHPEYTAANTEVWKDIPGFEGFYMVSNFGAVKSVERIITRPNGRDLPLKGRDMILSRTPKGYLRVQLRKEGKYKHFLYTDL